MKKLIKKLVSICITSSGDWMIAERGPYYIIIQTDGEGNHYIQVYHNLSKSGKPITLNLQGSNVSRFKGSFSYKKFKKYILDEN